MVARYRYRTRRTLVPRETTLATALRAARSACRKQLKEVGEEVGVTARTVARWESGRTAPPTRHRARLREVLAPLPPALAERLTIALGLPLPEPPKPPEAHRTFVDERIRVAAEHADIRASELRTALASLVTDLLTGGVPLEAVAVALAARG